MFVFPQTEMPPVKLMFAVMSITNLLPSFRVWQALDNAAKSDTSNSKGSTVGAMVSDGAEETVGITDASEVTDGAEVTVGAIVSD